MFSWRHLIFCWWLELCSLLLLCLKSNCGKGNGSNGDLLQRAYVSIVICNDPNYGPMPQLETPGHSQASLSQSSVGSLLLSPGSWYTQGFGCALKSFFPQSCGRSVIKSPALQSQIPWSSQSLWWISWLGNLLWALETLEKTMTPHSSTLAWRIPWWRSLVGYSPWGHEGNGNPLQCFCLEHPRDGGAWWAAIYGVAQSQTWL